MKKLIFRFFILLTLPFTIFSCQKEIKQNEQMQSNERVEFPETAADKQQVALIKEVSTILETVYQDPYAYYEVNAAIYSDFYIDERVFLKDLLLPESSQLYKTEKFLSFKAEKGRFAKAFAETMNRGNFPLLKKELKGVFSFASNTRDLIMAVSPADTSLEIFSKSNGVSIYFPYSENFSAALTSSYFDNVNKTPTSRFATIVAADREADSGPGQEPYVCGTRDNQKVCFKTVTVNDDYAERNATHIVGAGADPKTQRPLTPLSVDVVYIGNVACFKQYDRLINFSHLNGGGPDLRFMRGDAYLQQANGQTINIQDNFPVDLSRKDVRKGRWKKVMGVWDSNWEPANLNQVFAIWEQDKSGSQTSSGNIQTTLSDGSGGTTVSNMAYSYTVVSKDPIIRQLKWNRESFFLYNRGGLNNGCGILEGWMIYDCNQTVAYTMPTQ